MWNTDTLSNCVRALRAETGHSLSTVQGQNSVDTLKYLLGRNQYDLWLNNLFPPLKAYYRVQMVPGQIDYAYPAHPTYTALGPAAFELIRRVEAGMLGQPPVAIIPFGIPPENVQIGGSTPAIVADPPQYWDVSQASGSEFQVWPTPATNNYWLRMMWQLPLAPFIADGDMSTLDSTVVVLFTAAEILARVKAEDAALKLKKAQVALAASLGAQVTAKRKVSTLATQAPIPANRLTPYLDYIPMRGG